MRIKEVKIFYTKAVGLYPAGKRENVELWIREWQITFTLYKIHSGRKVKAGTGKKPGKSVRGKVLYFAMTKQMENKR